ncbi:MAG: ExeM/NucH family extracellular endonuclease [Paludibacteraceae bacterium]
MKNTKLLPLMAVLCTLYSYAQTDYRIYDLPQTGGAPQHIRTTGIVTALSDNGFFIQDKVGDNDHTTCDAVFVTADTTGIRYGDELHIVGTYTTDGIADITSLKKTATQQTPAITKLRLPDDAANLSNHVGEMVEFDQTLVVTNTYNWGSGYITVSSHRLMGCTETCDPGSDAYTAQKSANAKDKLYVLSSTGTAYPFANADGTLRTGSKVDNLQGTLTGTGRLTVAYTPDFYGNERPTEPTDLGDYNLKVCAFNMEYYITEEFDTTGTYGPKNADEAAKQHSKLMQALQAIDADIYGLLEIQQGQGALSKIVDALNAAKGGNYYAYIDDGTSIYGTFTKVGFVYRTDKVQPTGTLQQNNLKTYYRKMIQAFTLLNHGETFVFSLNHLKSKSGASSASGDDKDQNDGQGAYNATRILEAKSVVSACASATSIDEDILIMGDMNAYSREDPLKEFENAGYINILRHFYGTEAYSYSYNGEAGILDHIFANRSLAAQITGASVFHINADEHRKFEYTQSTCTNDMYRCSDHDAVIVGLKLGDYSHDSDFDAIANINADDLPLITNSDNDIFTIHHAENQQITIYDLTGCARYIGILSSSNTTPFSASALGLQHGMYLVRLHADNRTQPITLKLLIR